MTSWYDRPLAERPGGEVETPLGILNIEVGERYSVHCELAELVTVNTILCRVQVNSTLSFEREEWNHYVYAERVVYTASSYGGRNWKTTGDATENARAKVKSAVVPPLEKWLEIHFDLIEQGKKIADANLITRANHRLDTAIEEIELRRAELKAAQEHLEQHGDLKQQDRDLLVNLWGHHWKF